MIFVEQNFLAQWLPEAESLQLKHLCVGLRRGLAAKSGELKLNKETNDESPDKKSKTKKDKLFTYPFFIKSTLRMQRNPVSFAVNKESHVTNLRRNLCSGHHYFAMLRFYALKNAFHIWVGIQVNNNTIF